MEGGSVGVVGVVWSVRVVVTELTLIVVVEGAAMVSLGSAFSIHFNSSRTILERDGILPPIVSVNAVLMLSSRFMVASSQLIEMNL